MNEHERQLDKIFLVKTRLFESNYGLWTGMLAIDGLLVAAFAAASSSLTNTWLYKSVNTIFFSLCFFSAFQIIKNFKSARLFHENKLGSLEKKIRQKNDKHNEIEEGTSKGHSIKIIKKRENCALWLSMIAFLLLIILIIFPLAFNFSSRDNDHIISKPQLRHDSILTEQINDTIKDSIK